MALAGTIAKLDAVYGDAVTSVLSSSEYSKQQRSHLVTAFGQARTTIFDEVRRRCSEAPASTGVQRVFVCACACVYAVPDRIFRFTGAVGSSSCRRTCRPRTGCWLDRKARNSCSREGLFLMSFFSLTISCISPGPRECFRLQHRVSGIASLSTRLGERIVKLSAVPTLESSSDISSNAGPSASKRSRKTEPLPSSSTTIKDILGVDGRRFSCSITTVLPRTCPSTCLTSSSPRFYTGITCHDADDIGRAIHELPRPVEQAIGQLCDAITAVRA
jgi:hypothetical protein